MPKVKFYYICQYFRRFAEMESEILNREIVQIFRFFFIIYRPRF